LTFLHQVIFWQQTCEHAAEEYSFCYMYSCCFLTGLGLTHLVLILTFGSCFITVCITFILFKRLRPLFVGGAIQISFDWLIVMKVSCIRNLHQLASNCRHKKFPVQDSWACDGGLASKIQGTKPQKNLRKVPPMIKYKHLTTFVRAPASAFWSSSSWAISNSFFLAAMCRGVYPFYSSNIPRRLLYKSVLLYTRCCSLL